jgi:hypothetical protein
MDDQAAPAPVRDTTEGDLYETWPLASDLKKRRRAAVAQDRAASAPENRCHPSPLLGKGGATDGVNGSVNGMQTASREPVVDRVTAKPKADQLLPRHHSMLCAHKSPN